jgi:hypothetical protein
MTAQPETAPGRRTPVPWDDGIDHFTLEFHPIDYEAETGRRPWLELAGVLPADPGRRKRLLYHVVVAAMKAYRQECQLQSHDRLWSGPLR